MAPGRSPQPYLQGEVALQAVEPSADPLPEAIRRSSGVRKDVLLAARAALAAADPAALVGRGVKIRQGVLMVGRTRLRLGSFRRVVVLGGGKATALMALGVERTMGPWIDGGTVVVPDYQRGIPPLGKIRIERGTHPVPSERGRRAVRRLLARAASAEKGDLVICLFSGGGSALMPFPVDGVSVEDLALTTKLLLNAGAAIAETNCVRKHLSEIMGGRLVERLGGARVLTLLISDVVGDDIGSVASGPTVPDRTTFAMAEAILRKRRLWDTVPGSVRRAVLAGVGGALPETPKPGSRLFSRVSNVVIGSNGAACSAARESLIRRGYRVPPVVARVTGEARDAGLRIARKGKMSRRAPPWGMVYGGETTVHVRGKGVGGRNQELVLAAATALGSLDGYVFASFGTDGVDGPTDAAGAVCDSSTLRRAKEMGLEPRRFLRENDSYTFFRALGDLVVTGPTGTNVNDVMIFAKGGGSPSPRSP